MNAQLAPRQLLRALREEDDEGGYTDGGYLYFTVYIQLMYDKAETFALVRKESDVKITDIITAGADDDDESSYKVNSIQRWARGPYKKLILERTDLPVSTDVVYPDDES